MSDSILKIISINADYVPAKAQQIQAKEFLSKIFKEDNIQFETHNEVEFIDAGENFENIYCNVCGTEIPANEWQDQMDEAFKSQFSNLKFQTSCKHRVSLNHLNYQPAVGFAKFVINISNVQLELNQNQISELEAVLKTSIKIIWAYY